MMEDEGGLDGKVLAVPTEKILARFSNIQSLADIHELQLQQISHFFEHYKDLEKGKWVKVKGWEGLDSAKKEILDGIANYNNAK
jgi:inorganic pyrophosphatase